MFQPIRTDPPPDQVRRITFVPFLTDGRCVLIDEPGDPALPSGEVLDGEHYLLDTVLRVPLQTAGFRYQRFHPFGLDRITCTPGSRAVRTPAAGRTGPWRCCADSQCTLEPAYLRGATPGRLAGSAGTHGSGSRPGGTSPRRSPVAGRSWT